MTPRGPEGVPGSSGSNAGLGQAGVVLLLVGWILGIVMSVFAVLMGLFFLVWRRFAAQVGDWSMGPWREDAPYWSHWFMGDLWGLMSWFTVGVAVLSFVAIVVGTVLVYLGWRAVGQGDHRKAGILGIVGGAVMFLFSTLSGVVAILGGAFVLAASSGGGGGAAPVPAVERPGVALQGEQGHEGDKGDRGDKRDKGDEGHETAERSGAPPATSSR